MRETQVAIGAALMVNDFDTLIEAGDAAYRAFDSVTTSQFLAKQEAVPERAEALREVACSYAERVSKKLAALPSTSAFRWSVLRRELHKGLGHPGASGRCEDPATVADAVTQVNDHISWCLAHAQELIYEELGVGPTVERDTGGMPNGGPLGVSPERN